MQPLVGETVKLAPEVQEIVSILHAEMQRSLIAEVRVLMVFFFLKCLNQTRASLRFRLT